MDEMLKEEFLETTSSDLPKIPLNDPNNLMSSFILINVL